MSHLVLFSDIIKLMLEKIENISYFDAHFHIFDSIKQEVFTISKNLYGCSCFHSKEEWNILNTLTPEALSRYKLAFGLHPQTAGKIDIKENADFLENLIIQKKINAIGEAGFDFFTKEFKTEKENQIKMWELQLQLAIIYKLPLIVHCRKGNEMLFEYAKDLKKVPVVLFHSFMGTPIEAQSLLNKGINGFFSFGKQILNNNKKVIACVTELPKNVLLCETDAPFQYLAGELKTSTTEIKKVYEAAYNLRKDFDSSIENFAQQMKTNYERLFT